MAVFIAGVVCVLVCFRFFLAYYASVFLFAMGEGSIARVVFIVVFFVFTYYTSIFVCLSFEFSKGTDGQACAPITVIQ